MAVEGAKQGEGGWVQERMQRWRQLALREERLRLKIKDERGKSKEERGGEVRDNEEGGGGGYISNSTIHPREH